VVILDGTLPEPWIREEKLPGDASARSYSRLLDATNRTAILVRYPAADRCRLARDLEVRSWCAVRGLRIPGLLDRDLESGWAILEDLGENDADRTLAATPVGDRVEMALRAVDPLVVLARAKTSDLPRWNAPLDAARLRWELAGFELWYLRYRRGVAPAPDIGSWLNEIATTVDSHPKRVCHRDYHLNNLFFLDTGEVGVIDFQDMLVGPDTYDAVSLMCERGMPDMTGPSDRVQIMEAWAHATSTQPGWRERWRLVRIQRGLKVLGTFSRFSATGVSTYDRWMKSLAHAIALELGSTGAPSMLVDLLLD
jgi:aminoglycoside/choline kinase family phosphotransferase